MPDLDPAVEHRLRLELASTLQRAARIALQLRLSARITVQPGGGAQEVTAGVRLSDYPIPVAVTARSTRTAHRQLTLKLREQMAENNPRLALGESARADRIRPAA